MTSGLPPLRLLHTSDVHLGGGFRPPEHGHHGADCLCPLLAIERAVDEHRPDALLVVGDLFDHQRVASGLVDEVLGRLDALDTSTVLINGNHDANDDRTLYPTDRIERLVPLGPVDRAGRGGLVFLDRQEGSTQVLLDGALTVWGRSLDDHHRGFRPLDGVPTEPPRDSWWVVLGHGHFEDNGPDGTDPGLAGRSSPITPVEIEATGAHYVALGHWHVRTDVSTASVAAWYSGAPHGVASSGSLNLVELRPERAPTVEAVAVELPGPGCAPPPRSS